MDFSFSEENEMIRDNTRKFLEKNLLPYVNDIDKNEKIPVDFFKNAGKNGIISPLIDNSFGGPGL